MKVIEKSSTDKRLTISTSKRFADQGFFSGISFTVILGSYLYIQVHVIMKIHNILLVRYKYIKIIKIRLFYTTDSLRPK